MFGISDYLENESGIQDSSVKDELPDDSQVEDEEDTSNVGNDQTKARNIKRKPYTQVQLQLAYEAVTNGMSMYKACRMYGVPRATLGYRLQHKISDLEIKPGKKSLLKKSEELPMVGKLVALSDAGFNLTQRLVRTFGKEYVQTNLGRNPFHLGKPGKNWATIFLEKHLELKKRTLVNWARYGGKANRDDVVIWFGFASRYLEKMGLREVLETRQRVFTLDDVKLEVGGGSDIFYGCLFAANAFGNLLPPSILYPAGTKLTKKSEQFHGYQETEETEGSALYQYLTKVFQPWLNEQNVVRPVILFVDGHRHQMGYLSSEFCQQHQIVAVSLLPRSDVMVRPLNDKLFGPLEKLWHAELKKVGKHSFTAIEPLLNSSLERLKDTENIIRDGFYQSGLFPWNPDGHVVDDSGVAPAPRPIVVRVRKNARKPPPRKPVDPMVALFRKMLEARLSEQQLVEFQAQRHLETWQGAVEDTSLFRIWHELQNEIDDAEPEPEQQNVGVEGSSMDTEDDDTACLMPETVLIKQEDTNGYSLDLVKEEPSASFDEF